MPFSSVLQTERCQESGRNTAWKKMDNSAWNSEVSAQNSPHQQGQLRAKHRITSVMTQDLPLPKCLLVSSPLSSNMENLP